MPPFNAAWLKSSRPLGALGKGVFFALLEFEKSLGGTVPAIPKDAEITVAQADEVIRNASFSIFPGLRANG